MHDMFVFITTYAQISSVATADQRATHTLLDSVRLEQNVSCLMLYMIWYMIYIYI
jgi:hypothetical protein